MRIDLRGTDTKDAWGTSAGDTIRGNTLTNRLFGKSGDDFVFGGGGRDKMFGGGGDDTLKGNGGKDKLFGGKGDDLLDGGRGNDTLTGGDGADTFVFKSGHDVITDFEIGVDELHVRRANLTTRDVEGGVELFFYDNPGDTLFIEGVRNADLIYDISFI